MIKIKPPGTTQSDKSSHNRGALCLGAATVYVPVLEDTDSVRP